MTKTKDSKTKAPAQDKAENNNNHNDNQEQNEKPATTQKTEKTKDERKAADDGKKREFNEAELKRLKEGLRKEAEKIHKPQPKQFTPNTFNGLQPYFDMSTAVFVHELSTEVRHGYANRALATGLCEPAEDLRMDSEIPPKVPSQSSPRQRHDQQQKQKPKEDKEEKDRPAAEGSTRLPQFPSVHFSPKKVQKKEYYFNDVPTIRHEVHEQFSPRGSRKVEEDYRKTKADFYRMELDKMDEYSDSSRPRMRAAYFAYLQNTAGSSRAVRDCVRKAENPNKDSEDRAPAESKNEQSENDDRTTDNTTRKEEKDSKEQKDKDKTKKKEKQQQDSTAQQQGKQNGIKEIKKGENEKKPGEKGDKTKKKSDEDNGDDQTRKSEVGKLATKKKK